MKQSSCRRAFLLLGRLDMTDWNHRSVEFRFGSFGGTCTSNAIQALVAIAVQLVKRLPIRGTFQVVQVVAKRSDERQTMCILLTRLSDSHRTVRQPPDCQTATTRAIHCQDDLITGCVVGPDAGPVQPEAAVGGTAAGYHCRPPIRAHPSTPNGAKPTKTKIEPNMART
jgi:hypothetical protein